MRILSPSLLVSILLGSAFTSVVSQIDSCSPQLGVKCNVCTPGSEPANNWVTDCTLRVRMKCTYIDQNKEEQSCFPPGNSINNNEPEPTWKYTTEECTRGGANLEFEATVVYEMCNANENAFTPIDQKNFIKFAHNRRLEAESVIDNATWDNTVLQQSCRRQTYKTILKPCVNKWRGMALEMDGNLDQGYPGFCRCSLREYLLSEISDSPPDTPSPVSTPTTNPEICDSISPTEYTLPARFGRSNHCYRIEVRNGGRLLVDTKDPGCVKFNEGNNYRGAVVSNYKRTNPSGIAIFNGNWSGSISLRQDPSLTEAKFEVSGNKNRKTFSGTLLVPSCGDDISV